MKENNAKNYEVFISYRRSASDFAQLVASHLKSAGYRVFIDVESLRSGKFNTQLFNVIDSCKDFVIILPEGGLERCSSADDWVRMEYERAQKSGKNIVPVLLHGFSWPTPMPQGMEELKDYQGLSATSAEYYDLSIKRLRGYLKSRPHRLLKKVLYWLAGIVGSIIVLALSADGIISLASTSLYTSVADKLTAQICVLDLLGDSNEDIDTAWESFVNAYDAPEKKAVRQDLIDDLGQSMDNVLLSLDPIRKQLETARFDLSPRDALLLAFKDISLEELELSQPFVETFFDDIEGKVSLIREALSDGEISLMDKNIVQENADVFRHCSNGYYYGYLSIISLLPEKSRKRYNEMVSSWRHFPNGVGLSHSQDEYEQFIEKEYADLQRYNYDLSKRFLIVQQKYEESLLQYDNEVSRLVGLYDSILTQARDSLGSDAYRDWMRMVTVSSFLPELVEQESDPELLPIPLKASIVAHDLESYLQAYSVSYPEMQAVADAAVLFYQAVSTGGIPYRGLVVTTAIGQKGIQTGDIVTKVNGKAAEGKELMIVSEIIESGTMKELEVLSFLAGWVNGHQTVTIDPSKGPVIVLPLVPFED